MTTIEISSVNFNGEIVDVTFFPCSGGSINLGTQVVPFQYTNDNYEGVYDIYISAYTKTCQLNISCPSPSPTPTSTITSTPTITPTNTPSVTPTETPTQTPTNTPSVTPTQTPTETLTPTPTLTPTASPVINDWLLTENDDAITTEEGDNIEYDY
jgi:hypothetical protein